MDSDFPEVQRDNHVGTLMAVIPAGEGFTYLIWNRDDPPYILVDEFHASETMASYAALTRYSNAELVTIEAMREEYEAQK